MVEDGRECRERSRPVTTDADVAHNDIGVMLDAFSFSEVLRPAFEPVRTRRTQLASTRSNLACFESPRAAPLSPPRVETGRDTIHMYNVHARQ